MNLWDSLTGMTEVELTSASPQETLGAVNEQGIFIYRVKQVSDLTVRFLIHRKDWRKLSSFTERHGDSLKLLHRTGIYWSFQHALKRPVLLAGCLGFLLLMLYLPGRILFLRVEGNERIPDRQILSAAEACGIRFWASRERVRSEKVKNALLHEIPQLQWAGINTYGCTAVISVRERAPEEKESSSSEIGNLVAVRDGVIDFLSVTKGNALCAVGQAVKEGQTLISGYTDCGICIRATGAEGEVYAQTNRDIRVILPAEYSVRTEMTHQKRKISLLIGKKRINLWKDSGIWDAGCGRMYEEYYITLPGGYILPLGLAVETYTFYLSCGAQASRADAESTLADFSEDILTSQMISGELLDRRERIHLHEGCWILEGNYLCREMIGRVQWEQIGEEHGKSS